MIPSEGGASHEPELYRQHPIMDRPFLRGRTDLHHQRRRPVRGRGQLDRRGVRHSQIHHRRDHRQLCHYPAGNAGFRLCGAGRQRRYRRRQRGRFRHGQRGADHVPVAGLHGMRHEPEAVWRQGLPAAGGGSGSVCLYPGRPAFHRRECFHSADLRGLCRGKPDRRPPGAGHGGH